MLLTPERIIAASRICRWQGWTSRHYSILEHTNIGAYVLWKLNYGQDAIMAFLLHDIEETKFVGDVPTPQKHYLNEQYLRDVEEWNGQLYAECGLTVGSDTAEIVTIADNAVLEAEWQTISLVNRSPSETYYTDRMIRLCRVLIDRGECGTPELWWQLWNGEPPMLFEGTGA